jgi:hypothetical protein
MLPLGVRDGLAIVQRQIKGGSSGGGAAAERPPGTPEGVRVYLPLCILLAAWLQLTAREGPLSGQDLIRGAYVNTASKDIGIDPDYHK